MFNFEFLIGMYSWGRIMSCIHTMRTANRKDAKDAKGDDFFRIGTNLAFLAP